MIASLYQRGSRSTARTIRALYLGPGAKTAYISIELRPGAHLYSVALPGGFAQNRRNQSGGSNELPWLRAIDEAIQPRGELRHSGRNSCLPLVQWVLVRSKGAPST